MEHGQQLGRTLGFPTLNVASPGKKNRAGHGVYACSVDVQVQDMAGNGKCRGETDCSGREEAVDRSVYVYGYAGDAYGKKATVTEFLRRPETKFQSVGELKEQRDEGYCGKRECLENHPFGKV